MRLVTTALLFSVLFPCLPATAAEMAGDVCATLGATTLASDKGSIIACVIKTPAATPNSTCDKAGECVWKSMTGGSGTVPIGAIIAWPAIIDPPDMQNWLECKGQIITDKDYPELTKIIGTRVPDMRGLFLRGLGTQSFIQENGTLYGKTQTDHASASLGVVQGDAIRNIVGYVSPANSSGASSGFYGAMSPSPYSGYGPAAHTNSWGSMIGIRADRVVPVSNENRPINMAVRYLMRAH